jgi:hypothetical protein
MGVLTAHGNDEMTHNVPGEPSCGDLGGGRVSTADAPRTVSRA